MYTWLASQLIQPVGQKLVIFAWLLVRLFRLFKIHSLIHSFIPVQEQLNQIGI